MVLTRLDTFALLDILAASNPRKLSCRGPCHCSLVDFNFVGRYRKKRYRRRTRRRTYGKKPYRKSSRGRKYSGRGKKSKPVRGYTLRSRRGRVKYVGITNNPRRRAAQHRRSGKRGKMRVETGPLSRRRARRWEGARLARHRRKTGGRNPRYNKTRDGGSRRRSKGWW